MRVGPLQSRGRVENDTLGLQVSMSSWNMRVGVFQSRVRVESASLGSGVSLCSWNTRVGVVQSRSRVECGVRARGFSSLFKEYEGWCFAIPKVGLRVTVWARELPFVPGM